jgi:hypothetical protein
MIARLVAVVAVALAVLAVAGCGATRDSDDDSPAFTGAQVAREFERETGRALQEAAGEDEAWEQLSFGLDPEPALVRRYGIFSVYVVEPGNDEAVASLLSDKATGEPLEPDEQGIRWEQDSASRTWVAHKLYGDNVVLVWFSESTRPATDARWARLDAVLAGLPAATE